MIKYITAAFSLTPQTRMLYRKIGNQLGQKKRRNRDLDT